MPKLHKKKTLKHSKPIVTRDDVCSYEEYMKKHEPTQEIQPVSFTGWHLLADNVTMMHYEIRAC